VRDKREWRRLHKEKLYDYSSSDNLRWKKQKKNEIGGACSTYGESTDSYRVLVGKSKERKHLGD
jgi:hypothetical protein